MDLRTVLSYGVFVLGVLLCGFSVAFIFLGKKMAGGSGSAQVIEFKGVKVQTSSVLMFLIISVVIAALPLGLLYVYPIPSPVTELPEQNHPVYITGYVLDNDGRPLAEAQVSFSKLSPDGQTHLIMDQVVESDGSFNFYQNIAKDDRIKVTTRKTGYANQTLVLGINQVNYPAVLVPVKH